MVLGTRKFLPLTSVLLVSPGNELSQYSGCVRNRCQFDNDHKMGIRQAQALARKSHTDRAFPLKTWVGIAGVKGASSYKNLLLGTSVEHCFKKGTTGAESL